MKPIQQQSFNQERRARYKQLAAEPDKEHRNAELVTALGTESERTEVVKDVVLEVRGDHEADYKFKKKAKRITISPMKVSAAPGSGNESRAAKRARLKAGKFKLVSDESHPTGPCGNVGCVRCNGDELSRAAKAKRLAMHYRRSPKYGLKRKRERKHHHQAQAAAYHRAVAEEVGDGQG